MNEPAVSHIEEQERVNDYFQSQSSYWEDIYASNDPQGEIIRERHAAALDWVDSLALLPYSRVLEIGCGAGYMASTLAQRGLQVYAIDSIEIMVELARRHAAESGVAEGLSLDVGNVYSLAFEDNSFDLVIAIGVIPWLDQPELAIKEMARVAKPGGYVLLTANNRMGLTNFLDPLYNPALVPLKRCIKIALERIRLRHRSSEDPGATFHSRRFIDGALGKGELIKVRGKTLGFGPFSLFRRPILPARVGIALHHGLQRLADRGMPGFRSIGMSYLVLARKSSSRSPMRSEKDEQLVSDVTSVL
jgi:ubiquinone/menaquinone biosynthesis C-methylase UbiE